MKIETERQASVLLGDCRLKGYRDGSIQPTHRRRQDRHRGLPFSFNLIRWRSGDAQETQAMADDVSLLIIERTGDSDEN
jgi:sigma-B regulation protein RsbU (phosphoserine phosphatase)